MKLRRSWIKSRADCKTGTKVGESRDYLQFFAIINIAKNNILASIFRNFIFILSTRNMSNIKNVLIGGGSGFLGTAVTASLKQLGYHVKIVSRKPGPFHMTWTDLEKTGLPPNTTAVISLAGQNVFDITRRWTPGFKQNVWSSRVNTTAGLATAIKQSNEKPEVFISFSGVGHYKPSDTIEYSEDSPEEGSFDFLSELTRAWENASKLGHEEEEKVRRTIIRCGIVVGREGGVVKQMYWPFYFGVGGPVASGKQSFPWIHISDIVGLILFAIENKKVHGILNGVAPQIITNKEFSSALGRAMWRPSFLPMPAFILDAAFGQERAKIMTEGQKVIPKKVLELGYKFKYRDIDSACKQCVSGSD